MYRNIKRLFAASAFLTLCSITSLYVGSRAAAALPPAQAANPLAAQFGGDPGDGWMLAGGFLLLVALAFASAALMLWMREREG
jgi:di/tricarboxylate transporter